NRTGSRPGQSMSGASAARSPARGPAPKSCHPKILACAPRGGGSKRWCSATIGLWREAEFELAQALRQVLVAPRFPARTRGQFLSQGLRERKMWFLAEQAPVQMVCQIKHLLPGLVTLGVITSEKACWGSGV